MAVNTSAAIQAQMRKVEEARKLAAQEEKARLAKEQQFIKMQQEAEAELIRLQQQHAEALFSERLTESDALVKEDDRHIDNVLFPALDALDEVLAAAAPHLQRVEELFQQHLAVRNDALSSLNGLIAALPREPAKHAGGIEDSDVQTIARNGQIIRQHEQRIKPALSPGFALLEWIYRARDKEQLQRRIGVVYALHGRLYEGVDLKQPQTREQMREGLKRQLLQKPY